MPNRALFMLSIALALALGRPATAQYMYLDANGDSLNTIDDRLIASGEATLDVWLDTNHNRDGTVATCSTEGSMTINSYEFILHADGGTVAWSGFENFQPTMTLSFGPAMNSTDYYNGMGGGTPLEAGRFRLATLKVAITSGAPTIVIAAATPLAAVLQSAFGSQCPGQDLDNTLRLGSDWTDADGVRPPNLPPTIHAPRLMASEEGSDVSISADAVDSLSQLPPAMTVAGYPSGLTLEVSRLGQNATRATLSGHLGVNDAGTHSIVWTAIDDAGLSSSSTTTMDVSNQAATNGAAIVGYTTSGAGPSTVTEGPNGLDVTLGQWGGPLYPNGPCGEPVAFPVTAFYSRLVVDIDVGSGGKVGFTYRMSQTGAPYNSEHLTIMLDTGTPRPVLWQWGQPGCYGSAWRSGRKAAIVDLDSFPNQHVYLIFTVSGNWNMGTETQARIQSLAITDCAVPALAVLSPDAQALEDQPWDELHLDSAFHTKVNNFRDAVVAAGGRVITTCGSAYRTLEYQLHLREVWDAYAALGARWGPECGFLRNVIQNEKAKHCLKYKPGRVDKPDAIQHTKDLAIDVTIEDVDQDSIAALHGLYRPYKDENKPGYDPVHFEAQ